MTTSQYGTNAYCVRRISSIVAEAPIPNLPEFEDDVSLSPDEGDRDVVSGNRHINIDDVEDVLIKINNTEATLCVPPYNRQTTHQIKQIVDYLQNDIKQAVSGSRNLMADVADVCIGLHRETSFSQPDREDRSPDGQFANYNFTESLHYFHGLAAGRHNTAMSDPIPVPSGPHRNRYVLTCSSGSASVTSPSSPHTECTTKRTTAPQWHSEVIEHSQINRKPSLPRESKVGGGLCLGQLTSGSTQGRQKMDAFSDPVFNLEEEDEEQGDNTGMSEEEQFEIPDSVGCDELRKMRSKLAAKRCRDKKKRHEEKLKKELLDQMSQQTKIKFEIHQLEKVKERLRKALVSHDCKRFPWVQGASLTHSQIRR